MAKPLTEKEAAEMTGFSVHWFRKKRFTGGGPCYIQTVAKGSVRYRSEDLDKFFNANLKTSTSDQGHKAA
jgi:hypothetical protein